MAHNRLRTAGDRDVSILYDMFQRGTLRLAPEFQREGVWPRAAKAYLIDTILTDRPIPLLFFSKVIDSHNNRARYDVVDGQQRLRAIFEFMDDRFSLPRSEFTDERWRGRKYSTLDEAQKIDFLNYVLAITELKNYSQADVRDVFMRMNKYVVRLNAAEMRRARERGAFKEFCARLGQATWWTDARIITKQQKDRLRGEELAAELTILLVEGGPQDKKESVDVYYAKYADEFGEAAEVEALLERYITWIRAVVPDFSTSRWRKPVDLYALLGALDAVSQSGSILDQIDSRAAAVHLSMLEKALERAAEDQRRNPQAEVDPVAARYLAAASSQTDNIKPRMTRIDILSRALSRALQ